MKQYEKDALRDKGFSDRDIAISALKADKGLVDMKRPKKTKEQAKKEMQACGPYDGGERYPYGLTLSLENDEIEKLGLKSLPDVDTEVRIIAKAKVKSAESRDTQQNGKRLSCSFQITHLKVTT